MSPPGVRATAEKVCLEIYNDNTQQNRLVPFFHP